MEKEQQPASLEDMIPEPGEFTLKSTGATVHVLKPISVADESWCRQVLGDHPIHILQSQKLMPICRVIYHQLLDKTPFLAQTELRVDDEGEHKEVRVSGPEILAEAIIGQKEQLEMYCALLKTIGISQPMIDKTLEAGGIKKKKIQKKDQSPVGQKSLT